LSPPSLFALSSRTPCFEGQRINPWKIKDSPERLIGPRNHVEVGFGFFVPATKLRFADCFSKMKWMNRHHAADPTVIVLEAMARHPTQPPDPRATIPALRPVSAESLSESCLVWLNPEAPRHGPWGFWRYFPEMRPAKSTCSLQQPVPCGTMRPTVKSISSCAGGRIIVATSQFKARALAFAGPTASNRHISREVPQTPLHRSSI